jgi:hypothetical protein
LQRPATELDMGSRQKVRGREGGSGKRRERQKIVKSECALHWSTINIRLYVYVAHMFLYSNNFPLDTEYDLVCNY